ncbi:MAG: YbaB/EbfC family nucleoid-associated protein [Dongiaceae bacterium]
MNPAALQEEKEFLEDLVAAAINDAAQKVEEATRQKMAGVTAGMQLPPGMNLGF